MKKIENYIDGNLTSSSANSQKVYNPSTGEHIAEVVLSNKEDFKKLILSSKKSFEEWSNTTPPKALKNNFKV